jgi:hemoglobin
MNPAPLPTLYERLGGRAGLERLLERFYAQANQDPVLGPIFSAHVHDWPSHLETVTHFWSNHTGGPVLYRGGMGKHLRLGLAPEHFERWLQLWEQNARQECGPEIAAELLQLARHIAGNLQAMAAQMSALRLGAGPR